MVGDEVAEYLAGAGLGLTVGSSGANGVFAVLFPVEANDTATCVIEYASDLSVESMGASLSPVLLERPRFQVICRDLQDNARTCRSLAQSIYKKLRHYSGTMGSASVSYPFVNSMGVPFFLKIDENMRVLYACNYVAYKAEST
jgi:hypothetical protein